MNSSGFGGIEIGWFNEIAVFSRALNERALFSMEWTRELRVMGLKVLTLHSQPFLEGGNKGFWTLRK